MCFSFAAKFTEFPRNVTATEGQNVEMSCAFQSGSASVYLEIQWWFLRAAEDQEPGSEVTGTQVSVCCLESPPGQASHSPKHTESVGLGELGKVLVSPNSFICSLTESSRNPVGGRTTNLSCPTWFPKPDKDVCQVILSEMVSPVGRCSADILFAMIDSAFITLAVKTRKWFFF